MGTNKRKGRRGCLGGLAILIAAVVVFKVVANQREVARDKAELQKQLDLARVEGIPTTWAEFAQTIRSAPPTENAAPFYRQIDRRSSYSSKLGQIDDQLILKPTKANVLAANAFLASERSELKLVDQATALPRCWFDRDWRIGPAVLFPELTSMKKAAKLLALRGSIAVAQGHSGEAVNNVRQIFVVSRHAGEEGHVLAALSRLSIYTIGVRQVARWALAHPREPVYRKELQAALRGWPKLNLQEMHRGDLVEILFTIDAMATEQGRKDFGLKPENISKFESVMPFLTNRLRARTDVIKAERAIWKAYGEAAVTRLSKILGADEDLFAAMAAFPTASMVYFSLMERDKDTYVADQASEAKRLCYLAILRALDGNRTAKKITTKDLLSPFDGKPLTYKYDGRQVTITLSCPDPEIAIDPVKLPSDKELAPSGL